MPDSPISIVVAFLGLWFVAGVVLSVRAQVREARAEGRSGWLGGLGGVLLAVPPDVYLAGLALLSIAVWQAL